MLEVKLDDNRICYKQNMNAKGFMNVDIFASNPWNANVKGKITNFELETWGDRSRI